ncbi:hypothetical protein [Erwinia sp. PsM31]|uniref:hypothetical protein n=1 Tax=Erwinia sp. PsM31 TaxID=3030535 RepID=UPI00263B0512|nr:hypothetical protein [Erwinia sp. PsM31]MDN4629823.1 hypothetical protein [Erwinia sp. PsM31]
MKNAILIVLLVEDNMKFLSIALLFIYSSYASANECIAISDVESFIMTFKKNDKQSLIDIVVDSVKHYIEYDLLIKNKIIILVNISEVYYGWDVNKKLKYPVNTSAVF